jgi:xylulose-5-phosphate/fructose-6-phosphate phosphoketolase
MIRPGHLNRLPQTGAKGLQLKPRFIYKLIEPKHNSDKFGQNRPEIRNLKWSGINPGKPA